MDMSIPGNSADPKDRSLSSAALPEQMPCGADFDDLLEQIASGKGHDLTAHQRECTHCRAALAEIEQLWGPVAALAAERLEPPTDLVAKVMSLIRELAQEIWHVVLTGDRGVTRIAARVIAAIARRAAARAPGVRVVLGRSSRANIVADTVKATQQHQQPGSAVGIAGQRAVIDLAVVTDYDTRIPDVAANIRSLVIGELNELAGFDEVRVDIFVDDVTDQGPVDQPDGSRGS